MVAHPASNSAQLRVWVYPFIAFGDGDGPIPARVNKGQLLASCYPYIYIVRRLIDIDAKTRMHAESTSGGAPGMTSCGRRHSSDRSKAHTFDTVYHCSITVFHC
jgi:hypothetical protein